jgi:hypothetical protein
MGLLFTLMAAVFCCIIWRPDTIITPMPSPISLVLTKNTYFSYEVDSKYLVDGENLISVEIHQASSESEDFYFDLELSTTSGQANTAQKVL